jgi:hypothetical protein
MYRQGGEVEIEREASRVSEDMVEDGEGRNHQQQDECDNYIPQHCSSV